MLVKDPEATRHTVHHRTMKEVSFARCCETVVVVMHTFDFLFRQAMQALCVSVRFDMPPVGLCVFWL